MTLKKMISQLNNDELTSRRVIEEALTVIGRKNGDLNAVLRSYREEALAAADASDRRRKGGQALGALDGIPVVIKDNISYQDHITSAASKILENYVAPYDATVVTKLKEAGAIIIGQANMDEFAMGSSGENSAFGVTKNPRDKTRVPGGSSSGSAVAVAAGMVTLAYGSDTGGSIRTPASFCGVVGLKPTYGAVSRYGLLAMASSLDQIGPIATTVDDAEIGFEAIKGFDHLDSTSIEQHRDLEPKKRYTIGVPKQFLTGLSQPVAETLAGAIAKLEADGYVIDRDIDLPLLDETLAMYYLIMPAEASANLARYDGIRFGLHGQDVTDSRTRGFGPEVTRRILLGTFALSAGYADKYYKRAQAARQGLREQFDEAFKKVDLLLGSVSPDLPFKLGEKNQDPLTMYASDVFTLFVNLLGVPAISVPAGWHEVAGSRLPVGLQLVGKPWSEAQLFDVARKIERSL